MRQLTPLIPIAMLLSACGGSGGSDAPEASQGQFSLAISDAPVDSANRVVLAFNYAVLVPENGNDAQILDLRQDNDAPQQLDLLAYQGSNSATLINSATLPVGNYRLCVYALDGDGSEQRSFVDSDNGIVSLQVNANGSCFGTRPDDTSDSGRLAFAKDNELLNINSGINQFVVEFDLRQGLVDPVGQAGMFIKPNSVTLVNLAQAGTISGSVSAELMSNCETDSGAATPQHAIYLYAGDVAQADQGDSIGDGDYPADSSLQAPVAVANVNATDNTMGYEFGFVGAGQYSLGYSCTAAADLPDSHQTEQDGFTLYQSGGPITVSAEQTTAFDWVVTPQ
ncbi:DUF4382 domain-containing protein [uncultured Ferrimonas sp.]|uniref:DUF4382 domain-containing protein n=1 Tax=uncultured Ferrimonas sp. TaxID=432640 RepID=UPI0026052BAB|nr:DUF4382 domain-containing protein [uncultured Ferrimonas sp.]